MQGQPHPQLGARLLTPELGVLLCVDLGGRSLRRLQCSARRSAQPDRVDALRLPHQHGLDPHPLHLGQGPRQPTSHTGDDRGVGDRQRPGLQRPPGHRQRLLQGRRQGHVGGGLGPPRPGAGGEPRRGTRHARVAAGIRAMRRRHQPELQRLHPRDGPVDRGDVAPRDRSDSTRVTSSSTSCTRATASTTRTERVDGTRAEEVVMGSRYSYTSADSSDANDLWTSPHDTDPCGQPSP